MKWLLVLTVASCALAQNSRDLMRAAVGAQRAAIEAQRAAADVPREAVRKQQEQLRLESLVAPSPEPACDPISDHAVAPIIEGAAKSEDLGPALLRAVTRQESAFLPMHRIRKRSQRADAAHAGGDRAIRREKPVRTQVQRGCRSEIPEGLIGRYKGDLSLALAAYNAGPSAVDAAKGLLDIPETRLYVEAIL